MTNVVCPNCHSVTPPYQYCMACNSFLGDLLTSTFDGRSDRVANPANRRTGSNWFSISNFLSLIWPGWSEWIRHLTSSRSGKRARVPMDPHLWRDCRRTQEHGICKLPTASTQEGEVAVVAKVTNLAKFKEMVKSVTTMIEGTDDDPHMIVTARMRGDENEIEYLRNQDFVLSLKASRRLRPFLEQTMRETLASPDVLPVDNKANGGSGVIIGIIDFGLDFAHRNFRRSDGSTRILALWDQKATCGKEYSPKHGYGRLFTEDEINEALKAQDPYDALGYRVLNDSVLEAGAHGTYVADVAAGNKLGTGCAGVAPQADIVFVDLGASDTPMQGPQSVGSTFGDSVQLLEAVHFIFEYAKTEGRPCVINISLGTNGGPHDGTTLLEKGIDRLVKQKPNRAVVIAAGNSFGSSLHATGRVIEGESVDLKWRMPLYDVTSNELEIWYRNVDRFTVDLIDPQGRRVARVRPGETLERTRGSKGLITIVNRLKDSNNGENVINIFLERGVSEGTWTIRLRGDFVPDGRFHAWIERDERGQSRFVEPKDKSYEISNECTLSSIACGRETIVVSSYNAYEADLPLSETSSSGPTRDERKQPTISAPGEEVMAAQSGTLVLRHRQSGTSISAAVVTGTVALMLAEACARGITLTTDEIRRILIRTARRDPRGGNDWDKGFGFGRVCVREAVAEVGCGLGADPRQASAASSAAQ